jgi:alanyl-tRNA synthetase
VAPDHMRFDFTHFAAVNPRELEIIEEMVNEQIWHNRTVRTDVMSIDEAVATGAMALFGEKYQERVRVVSVEGFSKELCGGTHLRQTGQMGAFKVVSESSIASGVRRIEALTGPEAYKRFTRDERILGLVQKSTRVEADQLPEYLEGIQDTVRIQQKEIERLRLKLASRALDEILAGEFEVDGVHVVGGVVHDVDRSGLRNLADQLLHRFDRAVVALGAEIEGKAALVVMVTPEIASKHPAGKIVGALAAKVGGGGGGRPTMAEAGGKEPAGLAAAMASLRDVVTA